MTTPPEAAPGLRRGSRTLVLLALLAAAIVVAAYWRLAAPSPKATAQAYLAAEDAGDAEAMYDLLSSDSKRVIGSKEEAAARLIVPASALLDQPIPPGVHFKLTRVLESVEVDRLGEGAAVKAEIVISIPEEQRKTMVLTEESRIPHVFYLVKEGRQWRVDASSVPVAPPPKLPAPPARKAASESPPPAEE